MKINSNKGDKSSMGHTGKKKGNLDTFQPGLGHDKKVGKGKK